MSATKPATRSRHVSQATADSSSTVQSLRKLVAALREQNRMLKAALRDRRRDLGLPSDRHLGV